MRRELTPFDALPRGYGYSYYLWNRDIAVAYPVPINRVVRWARQLWLCLSVPAKTAEEHSISELMAAEYKRGLMRGEASEAYKQSIFNAIEKLAYTTPKDRQDG